MYVNTMYMYVFKVFTLTHKFRTQNFHHINVSHILRCLLILFKTFLKFNYTSQHILGNFNTAADALSRDHMNLTQAHQSDYSPFTGNCSIKFVSVESDRDYQSQQFLHIKWLWWGKSIKCQRQWSDEYMSSLLWCACCLAFFGWLRIFGHK